MKSILLVFLSVLAIQVSHAFPPAPHHEIYGVVRDERGNPLTRAATLILNGSAGELMRGLLDPTIAPGINYSLKVPMDSGTLQQLYRPTAMQPTMPFTIRVQIGNVSYVPFEITSSVKLGEPAGKTRLDLTLGEDRDGDGMADAWEEDLIAANQSDGVISLADINPDDDLDGDGVSNLGEYVAGTYAFQQSDRVNIEIVSVEDGIAHLRFLAITGRTYQLETSSDSKTYNPLSFTTEPDSNASFTTYRTDSVEVVDLYTPLADSVTRMFFILNVE